MAEESPFIEEPKKEAEPEAAPVDVDALMETLDQFDVKSPEKLQGKLQNAQDFAGMQSERDRLANEMAQLRQEVASSKQQPSAPIDDYQEGRPVDIETMVANASTKAIEAILDKREQEARKVQQKENETWVKITGNPRYALVKEQFEEELKDPSKVMAFRTGQIDAVQYVNDLIIDKALGIAKATSTAYKQMKGAGGVTPPHIEGNARVPQSNQEQITAKEKKLNELREAAKKPGGLHDDQEDALIDAALGDLLR